MGVWIGERLVMRIGLSYTMMELLGRKGGGRVRVHGELGGVRVHGGLGGVVRRLVMVMIG